MVVGESRETRRSLLVLEGYRCAVLSCLDVVSYLRFRSMVLDIPWVRWGRAGIVLCESHGVNCDFGGRRLRCLRFRRFGRGFV